MPEQPPSRPIQVTHVITDLRRAGAERTLHRLLDHVNRERFEMRVVTLVDEGDLREPITDLGVPVSTVGMSRGMATPADLWRLRQILREQEPDVVQTWMYHADLLGGIAARLAGVDAIAWNIRHTDLRPDSIKRMTRAVAWMNARLSGRVPDAIVCCAEAARDVHVGVGFAKDRMVVIHNGWPIPAIDRAEARASVRHELDLPSEALLVGRVGRFHPQKDHATFLRAMAEVSADHPVVQVVLCGESVDPDNEELLRIIGSCGLEGRTHLLGIRDDIERITAALDVSVSSASFGEGHPGVIGEAMAAGVPVVATDVGDSSLLVGDAGWIVPAEDPAALASALDEVLSLSADKRASAGERGRQRLDEHFSVERMVKRYEGLFARLGVARI